MRSADPFGPMSRLIPNWDKPDLGGDTAPVLEPVETDHLRRMAGRMARLGGWRLDLRPTRLTWSPETIEIHEEAPGFSPDVEQGLNYYAPEHQPRIRRAVRRFSRCPSSPS